MRIFPAPQQAATPIATPEQDALEQALDKSLQLALNYHQSGQIENAETLYRGILDVQPQHPEANYQLGRLAVQVNQAEAGLPHFAAALEAQPEQAHYWLDYIDALLQADQMEAARQVLELGLQHGLQGEAVDVLAARLIKKPVQAQTESKARVVPSRKPFKNTRPSPKEIKKMEAFYEQGRLSEAETLARSLTLRFPHHGSGWKMLGVVVRMRGGGEEALLPMQTAAEILTEDAGSHVNLGIVLEGLRRFTEAEVSYRRALDINPKLIQVHLNLGNIFKNLGRQTEAEASYRRALEIEPMFADGHYNLALALDDQGRSIEAEANFRSALQIRPKDAMLHSGLLFSLSLREAMDAETLFSEHCRFGEQFEAPLRAQWREHDNSRDPERRLQIGFVSGDLYSHAVSSFFEPILTHLVEHASLSLHVYSNNATEDHVSQRLRGLVRNWYMIEGMGDAALAEKIRADGIDILIDLSGHTDKHRLVTFARKPAPLQISWMGYPGTTGLCSMDYYLSDRFLLPPGEFDSRFIEKLVYLPAVAPFLPSVDAPSVNDLPALGNGYVTFGSFNRPNKLNRAVIALWSQLLRALPTSRMVLGGLPQDGQYDALIDWFTDEGIERQRLDFHPRAGMLRYLALHHQVDICLDTFPYAGSTTTRHALWMGVPTLTLAGRTVAGRNGVAISEHIGLGAFVAQNATEFVSQGLSLAADFSILANLRGELRERFSQSALCQAAVIAAGLERALRTMWRRWCADLPTESFEVEMNKMDATIQEMDK